MLTRKVMEQTGKVYLTKRMALCASHRLHSPRLSDEENKQIYGKCNHINGHGHNYVVKVTVCGIVDDVTGMVMNASDLKDYMTKTIMDTMDHKCLDKDIAYFKTHPSTVENIAIYVWELLAPFVEKERCFLYKVKVHETESIHAVYKG